jgi:hypothetical protein
MKRTDDGGGNGRSAKPKKRSMYLGEYKGDTEIAPSGPLPP